MAPVSLGHGSRRGMCPCSAVPLPQPGQSWGERSWGPAPNEAPIRGVVHHSCCLLPSLCRQQSLGSPEGWKAQGRAAPSGEGAGPPGQAPQSWVSLCGGWARPRGPLPLPWPELIAVSPAQLPRGALQKHPWPSGTSLSGSLWLCLTTTPCQCHPTLMLGKRSSRSGRARS